MATEGEPTLKATKQILLRYWVLNGALAGALGGFLFACLQILITNNRYNYFLLPILPFLLLLGIGIGAFQSLILWSITKAVRRHLGFVFRTLISLLLFVFPLGAYWWINSTPPSDSYHSFGTTRDEVASLRGIDAVKLVVNWGGSGANPEELTEAKLRNLVTFALDDAGIEVIDDNQSRSHAFLCINYAFWDDLGQKDKHLTFVRVELRQDVRLSRDANVQTEATTWQYWGSSLSTGSLTNSLVHEAVGGFVEDHRRANSGEVEPDWQEPARSKVRWMFINLSLVLLSIAIISGSTLQPWRPLAYGLSRPEEISNLGIVVGILLRLLVVFFLMESILVFILTLQSTYESDEFWRAHLFGSVLVARFLLSLCLALGRTKTAFLTNLALFANLIVLLLCWFDQYSNRAGLFAVEYLLLWIVFILTRFSITQSTLSYLKSEFRYYLID